MYIYTQNEYLMVKTIPSPDGRWWWPLQCPAIDPAVEDEMTMKITPAKGVDESCQGPRRGVAEDVAHPLGVQLGINNHYSLRLQIG